MEHCIFSSDGISLRFHTQDEKDRYEHESMLLNLKFYKECRDKYGIWAGNQNKYVKTREELTWMDGSYMEDLLEKYGDKL